MRVSKARDREQLRGAPGTPSTIAWKVVIRLRVTATAITTAATLTSLPIASVGPFPCRHAPVSVATRHTGSRVEPSAALHRLGAGRPLDSGARVLHPAHQRFGRGSPRDLSRCDVRLAPRVRGRAGRRRGADHAGRERRALARTTRELRTLDAEDREWLASLPSRLLADSPEPPAGRFNAGQKVNFVFTCILLAVLYITGGDTIVAGTHHNLIFAGHQLATIGVCVLVATCAGRIVRGRQGEASQRSAKAKLPNAGCSSPSCAVSVIARLVVAGSLYVLSLSSVGDAEACVQRILVLTTASTAGLPPPSRLGDAVVAVETSTSTRTSSSTFSTPPGRRHSPGCKRAPTRAEARSPNSPPSSYTGAEAALGRPCERDRPGGSWCRFPTQSHGSSRCTSTPSTTA